MNELGSSDYALSLTEFNDNVISRISTDKINSLIEDAMDWAHCFGLVMRTPEWKSRYL
jgi:hypothetical protein